MVFSAVPDPPVTLPVILSRVEPLAHLPIAFCWANVMVPLVEPFLLAHVIVIASEPLVEPFGAALNVPEPEPPVAAAGEQPVSFAVRLPPDDLVVSFVHLPGT